MGRCTVFEHLMRWEFVDATGDRESVGRVLQLGLACGLETDAGRAFLVQLGPHGVRVERRAGVEDQNEVVVATMALPAFDGTRWAGGRHADVLRRFPGAWAVRRVRRFGDQSSRAICLPGAEGHPPIRSAGPPDPEDDAGGDAPTFTAEEIDAFHPEAEA